MTKRTRLQRTISAALEANGHASLDDYVSSMRADDWSWREIAARLTIDSGESCSDTNLQNWFA